ncbi:MAG: magnesium/cobalt transporter CorA [Planctomycetes bacterium]|nr:magnesium/cobalt transporter CorA [Planctomycetota bacterium]
MITICLWNAATRSLRQIDAADLLRHPDELHDEHNTVWIDLADPSGDEENLVFQKFFAIHSLSLEDITRLRREPDETPHFPKVEEFPDHLFVIVNPLTERFLHHVGKPTDAGDHVAPLTQLSAVLTRNLLITHHYAPLKCVEALRAHLLRHEPQIERGPDYLFHLILDSTVDEFVPVIDYIEDTLDGLEAIIVHHPKQKLYIRLLHIKREIILLRKTLIAEREVLVRLARGEFVLVDERETVYYRNVYDHLVRFTALIEGAREMTSDLMQTYLSAQSNHLNQIMKVLTMISTVVLPMTLIAGIYGMNFKQLIPDVDQEGGFFFAVLLMLFSGFGSLAFFYWKRWL